MKKVNVWILISILSLFASIQDAQANTPKEITGIWLGTMKVSEAVELQIGYIGSRTENGILTATMNIIEQKAFDIPMDSVSFSQDSIQILFTAAGISYSGILDADNQLIQGYYEQGEAKFELILHSVDELPGEVVRTQTPQRPFPYIEKEVVFHNKEAQADLAGTLTIPYSGENFPAIILVHGSGHTDRNETKMGHFMLLADYFTRNGFAVLRYDKRGVGNSTGNYDEATTIDFAHDVKAGINYLKCRKEIDNTKIGIIGHSEGTLIATIVASEMDKLSFIVLLGVMGSNGGEIRLQQTEMISKLNGVPEDEISKELKQINEYHAILRTDDISDNKFKTIKELYPNMSDGMISYMLKPWYLNFISIEPLDYLKNVSCPVLALTGSKDVQCPPEHNLPLVKKVLENVGNKNFMVKSLPGLNHLLQTSKSGLPIEYENIAEIIAPSALDLMLDWITPILN